MRISAVLMLGSAIVLGVLVTARVWARLNEEPEVILMRPFASGFDDPLYVTHAGDGSGEIYVVERAGTIRRVAANGAISPVPVLDIEAQVSTIGERGMLAMAFPPGPGPKDRFYVYYTDAKGSIVLSRFTYDGERAGEETVLVDIPRGDLYHWGGSLQWGPDGLLYFATGDTATGGDPRGVSQDPASPHAKLYRFDPDVASADEVRLEVVAMGLRNPFRFSFDLPTDRLFLTDVGEGWIEEINIVPTGELERGVLNFGWNIMEGGECFETLLCDPAGLVLPDIVYSHSEGRCAVTGGYVYRGELIKSLRGQYIFGDYCTGEIFGVPGALRVGLGLSGFGTDEAGELYATDMNDGVVFRFEPENFEAHLATPTPAPSPTPTPTADPAGIYTYDLAFRWTLLSWYGADEASPASALGAALPDVTAVFGWDGATQSWRGFFPAGIDTPGANDLTALTFADAYWVATSAENGTRWAVPTGDAFVPGTPVPPDAPLAATVELTAGNLFEPAEVAIAAGGTVTFEWQGGVHNLVTGGLERPEQHPMPAEHPDVAEDASLAVTFAAPGVYPFMCEPHAAMGMTGEVTVY